MGTTSIWQQARAPRPVIFRIIGDTIHVRQEARTTRPVTLGINGDDTHTAAAKRPSSLLVTGCVLLAGRLPRGVKKRVESTSQRRCIHATDKGRPTKRRHFSTNSLLVMTALLSGGGGEGSSLSLSAVTPPCLGGGVPFVVLACAHEKKHGLPSSQKDDECARGMFFFLCRCDSL